MSKHITPLDDRIVVKRLDAEEKTSGGIFLPTAAQEKPQQAKVIAAGPGKKNDAGKRNIMEVKPGDIIVLGKYSGTDVTVDGEELVILRESDVLAILHK